jgi:AcrR family transcriptional regulator
VDQINKSGSEHRDLDRANESSQDRPLRRRSPSNDELLDKAFELFVEHGYEGTSLDAICGAAGLAKRTIYIRFNDKETLFKACVQRAVELWVVPIEELVQLETENLEESLGRIGRLLLDRSLSPEGLSLMQLTFAVSRRMPNVSSHNVEEGTRVAIAYLADLFRRRISDQLTHFAGAEEAAIAFLNLIVGGPVNMVCSGFVLDDAFVERYVKAGVQLFLHGLVTLPDDATALAAVENENSRLKKLLAETMLELDAARRRNQH